MIDRLFLCPAVIFMVFSIPALSGAAELDLQGHRGARGLAPENTLAGFERALAVGVSTLEMDVAVTRDGVVVVSHDRRLNPDLTRGPDGLWLTNRGPALFHLDRAELNRFDVGRLNPATWYARQFPHQEAVDGARVPALAQVSALAKGAGNDWVQFSIEIKTDPRAPSETLPPKAFAEIVSGVLRKEGIVGRSTVQSFDWRSLRHLQETEPAIKTAYLSVRQRWLDNIQSGQPGASPWTAGFDIDDYGGSVPRLVKAAGGTIWSPFHEELTPDDLELAHRLRLKVIVWTVKRPARMEALIEMGVDGIITDYPDRLRLVMTARGLALPKNPRYRHLAPMP